MLVGAAITVVAAGALLAWPAGPAGSPPFPEVPRPIVFAHRGGAAEGPESTLPTMLEVLRRDPRVAMELDVHRSSDGHIVVIHDDKVDRTTDGSGRVADLTLAELQTLDAGFCATPGRGRGTARGDGCRNPGPAASFPLRGKGYRIPTLDEVLQALPPDVLIGIEVKEAGFEEALAQLLRRSGRSRLVVGSALDGVAAKLAALLPETPRYFPRWAGLRLAAAAKLTGGRLSRPLYQVFATPRAAAGVDLATPALLAATHRLGVLVAYFTVNDEAEMERLFRAGADAIITDYPGRARAVLDRIGRSGLRRDHPTW